MNIRQALKKHGIAHLYNVRLCDMTKEQLSALTEALKETEKTND